MNKKTLEDAYTFLENAGHTIHTHGNYIYVVYESLSKMIKDSVNIQRLGYITVHDMFVYRLFIST